MAYYVWCKNSECRVPSFRCLICEQSCYPREAESGEALTAIESLKKTGRVKERYVVRRKESPAGSDEGQVTMEEVLNVPIESGTVSETEEDGRVFLLEDGRLKPFDPEAYTTSTLYEVVESFAIERRLVRPEEASTLVYEGKRPSRKSNPILVSRDGGATLLESWSDLETKPEVLAAVDEVLGAVPVRQIFVLKRK